VVFKEQTFFAFFFFVMSSNSANWTVDFVEAASMNECCAARGAWFLPNSQQGTHEMAWHIVQQWHFATCPSLLPLSHL
jgi:hypothetical protein